MAGREQKKIECKLLLTVSKDIKKEGQLAIVMRCVDWISEGKHSRLFEKREFYPDGEGGWKMGKAKGFNLQDLSIVKTNWANIVTALGSTLPEDVAAPRVSAVDESPDYGQQDAIEPAQDF